MSRTCNNQKAVRLLFLFLFIVLQYFSAPAIAQKGQVHFLPVPASTNKGIQPDGIPPVAAAHIYMFAVGANGPNTGGLSLINVGGTGVSTDAQGNGYVTTDSAGNFNLNGAYTCPSVDAQVYFLSSGGSAGGSGNNPYLVQIAMLPVLCSQIATIPSLDISIATTVAAAFALTAFADTSHDGFSASPGSTQAVYNAALYANSLVSSYTGNAISDPNNPTVIVDINTISDVLATCGVATGGTACTQLMAYTTISGHPAPTDIWQAAVSMAVNPKNNTTNLFNRVLSTAPYQPTYSSVSTWQLPTVTAPTITSLSSQAANIGFALTISGSNFLSASSDEATVVIGGVPAAIQSITQTLIATTIPQGATTGNVQVFLGQSGSNPVPITLFFETGVAVSLSPTSSTFGTPVTISVNVLSSDDGPIPTGAISCNVAGTQVGPTTQLNSIGGAIIQTASLPVGNDLVTCTYSGSTISSASSSRSTEIVSAVIPSISKSSLSAANVGAELLITGSGFGSSVGTVLIGGVNAVISFWGPENILVHVPSGAAASGSIQVITGSQTSNVISVAVPNGIN